MVPTPVAQRISLDGIGNITAPNTVVNRYGLLKTDTTKGQTLLTLATPVADLQLKPSDTLLLYQAQGAQFLSYDTSLYGSLIDPNGAGSAEFVSVERVDSSTNTITVIDSCGGLQLAHTGLRTQIIRVPQYQFLNVSTGASITAPAWNGSLGGIVALLVEDTLDLQGKIDVTGLGLRGGQVQAADSPRLSQGGDIYRSPRRNDGGAKGESVAGFTPEYQLAGQFARGAPTNGGGGGSALFSGGGGGANGGDRRSWSGVGVMTAGSLPEQRAWQLDPAFVANRNQLTSSSGGGRGGYSLSQAIQDPTLVGPNDTNWGGDSRRDRGGLGGEPVLVDSSSVRLYGMAGGGGAGDNTRVGGGSGGAGGGIALVVSPRVVGAGEVLADGNPGIDAQNSLGGGGGGGAGGTIALLTDGSPVSLRRIQARGGDGGRVAASGLATGGPGGGGGGGFIQAIPSSSTLLNVNGGTPGYTTARFANLFPQNGATSGGPGTIVSRETFAFAEIPACTVSDLAVQLKVTPTSTTGRTAVTYTATVYDRGPTLASEVELYVQLPETSEVLKVTSGNWRCETSLALVVCRQHALQSLTDHVLSIDATPPLARSTALATATVRSRSGDPDVTNNVAQVALSDTAPLFGHALGGGIACQLTVVPSESTPTTLAWLVGCWLLGFACMRRSASRARNGVSS